MPSGTWAVRVRGHLDALYAQESRQFALWLPVCLGIGIGVYFQLKSEPDWTWAISPVLPLLLIISGAARRVGWGALALAWLVLALTTGFSAAIISAHTAKAPAISVPLGETVEGRVLELSRARSGAPRLLLDQVQVYGVSPERMPKRLRLTLLDDRFERLPLPGERIRVYATLMPAGRPVEPGGFDFHRRAFFQSLGGVGLSRGHLLILPRTDASGPLDSARIWLASVRYRLSKGLRDALPGPPGAFAAAIIVGDRVDIAEEDAEALRASNLAHLLAISGLHMGILTGLVFFVVRFGLSLPPQIALRYSTKKWAAAGALAAGAAYLMLSGATIATQRAFIMVAVALGAVMLDRPALTLRSLAVAATIILLIRPISLLDAGFQMSFAATAALVAGFQAIRGRDFPLPLPCGLAGKVLKVVLVYVGALLFSSLLAGLATAPISAFHFNRTAPYGLLANLLAVPLMGLWIAPFACLAAIMAPIGLAGPPLQAMGWGIARVLDVAHWVAGLPGAVQPIAAAPALVLPVLALGSLWFIIWRGRWRWGGVAAVLVGLVIWQGAPSRPTVLVSPEGRLIGVLQAEGRSLDHATAYSFAARTWLQRDGDPADQSTAAGRAEFQRTPGRLTADLPDGWRLAVIWGRDPTPENLATWCGQQTVLVARYGPPVTGDCLYVGQRDLRQGGAVAVTIRDRQATVQYAEDPAISRLWSR
ncbi:MAG: ComEC/Rec2 family competence protein [Pseudomonadota bacterium]